MVSAAPGNTAIPMDTDSPVTVVVPSVVVPSGVVPSRVVVGELDRGDALAEAFSARAGSVGGLGRVEVGEQHDELLAAEAPDRVVGADLGAQHVGHRAQDLVPDEVAVAVVDTFEVVEVDHENSEGRAPTAGAGERAGRPRLPVHGGGEAGLGVGVRRPGELLHQETAVHRQQRQQQYRDQPRRGLGQLREDDAQGQDPEAQQVVGGGTEPLDPGCARRGQGRPPCVSLRIHVVVTSCFHDEKFNPIGPQP